MTLVHIEGFKRFVDFDLDVDPRFSIIVGDNETGKSSLLEAIGLVLTGLHNGRLIQYAIDPYLFNAEDVAGFFDAHRKGEETAPPRILIEAYFEIDPDDPDVVKLQGTNNARGFNCPGLAMTIEVDSNYLDELKDYAGDESNPSVVPVEFYKATWRAFSGDWVTGRTVPFKTAMIDTSLTRIHRGPSKYVSQVVGDALSEDQRRELSLEYKKLRHAFSQEPGVKAINEHLAKQGSSATSKRLTIQMDMSAKSTWDSTITAHLDDLPFDCAGKGEQCRVQLRLAIAGSEQSHILLIEEPENHLSHSNLGRLMDQIKSDCGDRQVVVATHSAFVLNKLGIDSLRLLSHGGPPTSLVELPPETREYFMRLPGYDTLRLILARRSILVEGPSDELIVQRAYRNVHGKLPLEDGVDVISVGSLAFNRFLDIALLLHLDVRVVTDNDGDVDALRDKYSDYVGVDGVAIRVCYDLDESCQSLEPQLVRANSLSTLNSILGTSYSDEAALLRFMVRNKTDCALKMLVTKRHWVVPKYIQDAIE